MDGLGYHHNNRAIGVLALIILTISACGGGGGTIESPGTPTYPTPPVEPPQLSAPPYSNFEAQAPDEDNFDITVREFELATGAGFIIPILGKMMRMPGLPAVPASEGMDIDENGVISGLS